MPLRPVLLACLSLLALIPATAQAATKPDLTVSKLTEPVASMKSGTPLKVTAEVRNKGKRAAKASSLGVFLSKDAKRSKDDPSLGRLKTKALKAGKKGAVKGSPTVPLNTVPGAYRLIVCADVAAKVKESGEKNNCRTSKKALVLAASVGGAPSPVTLAAQTLEDIAVPIRIQTTDPDSCDVDVRIVGGPASGTVSAPAALACTPGNPSKDAHNVVYTPAANFNGKDAIQYSISDGINPVQTATLAITVVSVDDPTDHTLAGPPSATQGDLSPLTVGLADVDDPRVRTTLSAEKGFLRFPENVTYCSRPEVGNAQPPTLNKALAYEGTPASIANCFKNIRYRPAGDDAGTDTITLATRGGSVTTTTTIQIGVIEANDAPDLVGRDFITIPEEGTFNPDTTSFEGEIVTRDLGVSDLDAGSSPVQITVNAPNGTSTITGGTSGLLFNVGDGTSDKTMTFQGTVAAVDAALKRTVYKGDLNYAGTDTWSFSASDLGNTGAGGAKSDTLDLDLTITPVNDAPSITKPAGWAQTNNTSAPMNAGNSRLWTVSDVDAASEILDVTWTTNRGTITLATTTGLSFTTGDGTADATMTFAGTLTTINNAINGANYNRTNSSPGGTMSMTVDDNGATGSGGVLSDVEIVNFP